MIDYLRLEVRRTASDVRFLVLIVGLPVAMYLLFTNVFGGNDRPVYGLNANIAAMVSMAAFGAIGAALTATAPRIAQERSLGWMRQLRILPIPGRAVIGAKILAAMLWAVPSIVLVCLAAVVDHGITLAGWQWAAMIASMTLGSAPFAALGVWIGYVTDDTSAFGVMYGIYLFFGAVGGLWMPTTVLPRVLQRISSWVPSNRFAELGWNIARGVGPSVVGIGLLAGWLAVFAVVATAAYRRSTAVR